MQLLAINEVREPQPDKVTNTITVRLSERDRYEMRMTCYALSWNNTMQNHARYVLDMLDAWNKEEKNVN